MNRTLLLIVTLGLLLRLVVLSDHPAGFTPDEASFGYDAYSILKTGSDQWGNKLPLTLKSFGDYKMALYSYLAVPSIALFGLSEFATRLPNALLGSGSVVVLYFLVLSVYKRRDVALLSAFLLAISPWHIPLSRGAFEANLTVFFLPLSLHLLHKGVRRPRLIILAAVFAGVNLFSYHAARLLTPPIIILATFSWYRKPSKLTWGGLVFGIFLLVALSTYLTGAGARAASVGIIGTLSHVGVDRYAAYLSGLPDFLARVFNNKLVYFLDIFFHNYFSYFSPQFLITHGPAESTYGMIPGVGVLHFIEAMFLTGFVWKILIKGMRKNLWLVGWLLLAPIPAALTIGPGYAANRAAIMMPAIQIAAGIGGVFLYGKFRGKLAISKNIITAGFVIAMSFSVIFFVEEYFYQQPAKGASSMIYGARQVLLAARAVEASDEIFVTKKISEPHIYVAFYTALDPQVIQEAARGWNFEEEGFLWVDQLPVYRLKNYTFKLLDYKLDSAGSGSVFVGTPEEFPESVEPLYTVYYPNGTQAYYLVNPNERAYAYAPEK